jgi:hypothetical protein
MSNEAKKIIFRRLVREYEFLVEDLKDIDKADSQIKNEFFSSITDIDSEGILQTPKMDILADDWAKNIKELEDLEKESNKNPDFKSLFRKVVVKCHPDRLDKDLTQSEIDEYVEIYQSAMESNETEDWALLIRCAIKLKLDLPESAYDQIDSIVNSINKLKERQTTIINSIAWQWYNTSADDSKLDILKKHLDFMKSITGSV